MGSCPCPTCGKRCHSSEFASNLNPDGSYGSCDECTQKHIDIFEHVTNRCWICNHDLPYHYGSCESVQKFKEQQEEIFRSIEKDEGFEKPYHYIRTIVAGEKRGA